MPHADQCLKNHFQVAAGVRSILGIHSGLHVIAEQQILIAQVKLAADHHRMRPNLAVGALAQFRLTGNFKATVLGVFVRIRLG